jgi:hypothetical protein
MARAKCWESHLLTPIQIQIQWVVDRQNRP